MKYIALPLLGAIAGYWIIPSIFADHCDPQRGQSSTEVLQQCGTPNHIGRMESVRGSIRSEFEYSDMLVVFEDGKVLSVVR